MALDIFSLIDSYRFEYTKIDKVIAEHFMGQGEVLSIVELGRVLSVSPSSITRFSKKIGLNNYKELLFLYRAALANDKRAEESSLSVVQTYYSILARSEQCYNEDNIREVCYLINGVQNIHFWGMGFNTFVGLDFQFKFSRLGKNVLLSTDHHSILMSAHSVDTNELIIVSTRMGTDKDMLKAVKIARTRGVKVVLLTSNEKAQLIPEASLTILGALLTHEESLGSISPQVPMLIQLDIIYEEYKNLYSSTITKWIESENILKE